MNLWSHSSSFSPFCLIHLIPCEPLIYQHPVKTDTLQVPECSRTQRSSTETFRAKCPSRQWNAVWIPERSSKPSSETQLCIEARQGVFAGRTSVLAVSRGHFLRPSLISSIFKSSDWLFAWGRGQLQTPDCVPVQWPSTAGSIIHCEGRLVFAFAR